MIGYKQWCGYLQMKTELPSAIHLFSSLIPNTIFPSSCRFYYTNILILPILFSLL